MGSVEDNWKMKQSQTKDKSIGNLWLSRIVTLILGVAVCFCLFVLVQVVSRGYASLGGYSFFKVVTGSMEPNLSVGELLLTKQIDPAEIAVDDIISFRSRSPGMIGAFIFGRKGMPTWSQMPIRLQRTIW